MKKFILILLLLFSSVAVSQVSQQTTTSNTGNLIIRFYNALPNPVSCYYRDQFNYYTFIIPPRSYSMWYPVYGRYQWQC